MQATRRPRDGKKNAPGAATPEASKIQTHTDPNAPSVPTEGPARNPEHLRSGETPDTHRADGARSSRARELTLTPLALYFSAREAVFFGPGYHTESSATPVDVLEARALAEGADGVLAACVEGVEPGRLGRAVIHALEPWAAAGADVDPELTQVARLLIAAWRGWKPKRFTEALERQPSHEAHARGPGGDFVAYVSELFLLEEDAADCGSVNDVTHIVALQLVGAAARIMAADQVRVLEALAEERLLGNLPTRPVALAAERRSA